MKWKEGAALYARRFLQPCIVQRSQIKPFGLLSPHTFLLSSLVLACEKPPSHLGSQRRAGNTTTVLQAASHCRVSHFPSLTGARCCCSVFWVWCCQPKAMARASSGWDLHITSEMLRASRRDAWISTAQETQDPQACAALMLEAGSGFPSQELCTGQQKNVICL